MSDKKRSAKGKWKNALFAAALTASVILALPAWSVRPAEAAETPSKTLKTDKGKIVSSDLTIERTDDGKQGDIKVDLYMIAEAEKNTDGYDAYTLKITDAKYKSLETKLSNALKQSEQKTAGANALYRDLAQDAARIALGKPKGSKEDPNPVETGIEPITLSKNSTEKFSALPAGMYLVVAHGANLTPEKYVGEIDVAVEGVDEEGEPTVTQDKQIVTMAYNNDYVYRYLPELISLPVRGASGDLSQEPITGSFSTAQSSGDWQYAVTVQLKAEELIDRVPLQITKTFSGAENAVLAGKNGCIFQIEATLNGQNVYSNVVPAEFVKGQTSVTIDTEALVPVGSVVEVTEVYDGAAFKGEGQNDDQSVTKTAMFNMVERRYDVSFTNTYNEITTGGDIVTNSFTRQTDGSYDWNNPRPAQSTE